MNAADQLAVAAAHDAVERAERRVRSALAACSAAENFHRQVCRISNEIARSHPAVAEQLDAVLADFDAAVAEHTPPQED